MGLGRDTRFTWYGHACVEVRTPGGKTVLIDPWFGNPKSPKAADAVDRCDVLLVTHGHFDHLGDALSIARRTRPSWPAIHELSLWLGKNLGDGAERVIGMNKGGTVAVDGLRVTMTHAVHSAGDVAAGSTPLGSDVPLYLGEPAGFVVEVENGFRFYHAGDTTAFGEMRFIGELLRPDLAILPIGDHFTMGPREAALAVELLGVRHVLPIHYGTFPILVGTPDELRAELAARGLGDVTVHALEPGGTLD
ncbi:MAG TPA: metal-dependent hydrolase [Candidatus Limnocylindrales bacterium]|nr:metal-dependent hydrolase [Candidatus Limnocylindrales bacterium]